MYKVSYIRTFKFRTFKDADVCSVNVRSKWNCSLLSVSYCYWSFSSAVSHLLSLLQSVTLLTCSIDTSPCIPALYCTTVLFKVLYCKIKNVLFFAFVFMCYLYEKYYKLIIVEYCIADCVSQVPRLTLLDLRTSWTYECTLKMELFRMSETYCISYFLYHHCKILYI